MKSIEPDWITSQNRSMVMKKRGKSALRFLGGEHKRRVLWERA